MIAYIRFLQRSTNQHGVHSPFVYDLVTKCFYDTKKRQTDATLKKICAKKDTNIRWKEAKLILRLLAYFKIHEIVVLNAYKKHLESIVSLDTSISVVHSLRPSKSMALLYTSIDTVEEKCNVLDTINENIHNDSFLLIPNIYKSKDSKRFWELLKTNPSVQITIDTFYTGFVFFRKQQAKEHFVIRL